MLDKLAALRERTIYHVAGTHPAVYYIADRDAGGVLVNAPPSWVSVAWDTWRSRLPKRWGPR